jgi:hypothetical protein
MHASENKIHDDGVAQRLGFTGGLVPGVEVYVYMTHIPLTKWGLFWLEHGYSECRLLKPVYDGHIAIVTEDETGEIKVESDGVLCATGRACMPEKIPSAPELKDFPYVPPPATRPAATPEALPPGKCLATHPFNVTSEVLATYVREAPETNPVYLAEGIVQPGLLLRRCNEILGQNVVMKAWIHTGSKIQSFAIARVGDEVAGRARVISNYEHKGHKMVDLDVLLVANGKTPIARVVHSAIYLPRQLA